MFSALTNVGVYRLPLSGLDKKEHETVTDHLGSLDELGPRLMDAVKALFAQSEFGYLSTKIVLDLVKLEGIPVVINAGSPRTIPDAGFVYVAEGEAYADGPVFAAAPKGRSTWVRSPSSLKSDVSWLYLPVVGIERFRRRTHRRCDAP